MSTNGRELWCSIRGNRERPSVGDPPGIFNRPNVTYRDAAGQQFAERWRGDAVVLSVGAVYSLF